MEILKRSSLVRSLSQRLSDTMPQGFAEEAQEKGKKKKWWGDLFKRRVRKVSDSSSDEEDDTKKRGFLLRRKKQDIGSKDVTNSFVINQGIKGRSLDSVRSTGTQNGKKRIKAKVEASREQLAKDSSSDEGSSYTSSLPSGGSFPRRSRAARTERHNRRLWSASVVYQESSDYDTKYRAKTRSATPSPAASPKFRQRACSQDTVAPPPPPRRMEIPKYHPPIYTAPNPCKIKPKMNGLTHHSSDPILPRDWGESSLEAIQLTEEKKPPAPPRKVASLEDRKHYQANLEEALNELEAIYKKLEDLQDQPDEDVEHCLTDDMAYRRLNKREPSCQDVRDIMSQAGSYLLVSPTLSPPPLTPQIPTGIEPDITYDDVVYRSINHTNNTLKILDPQPPFGIPLGPISPASNSDYLHAEPTFETNPPDTPDVVRDDLAFRNLRKDSQELRKKKAVRSLSANLSNVILKNNNNLNTMNNNIDGRSQSYSDIPEEMRLAQRVLDMRRAKLSATRQRPQLPRVTKEELRRKFFAEVHSPSETDLLKELEDEARATSLELEEQLSKSRLPRSDAIYSKSMADLLKELTKNLDYDFGQDPPAVPCSTCGSQDPSKQLGGDSSNNNCYKSKFETESNFKTCVERTDRPKLMKESAVCTDDSPKPRLLPNIPQCKAPNPRFGDYLKHIAPTSPKEVHKNNVCQGFSPYNSQSLINYTTCDNLLPKIPRKINSPRPSDNYSKEENSRIRVESPKPRDTLDELCFNLTNYKAESPRTRERTFRPHPELLSSSLKVKSEFPKPQWDNFKGRSESYHGPFQSRISPKLWEPSSPCSYRRQTPSPMQYKDGSPQKWEKSIEDLHNIENSQLTPRRLSPWHWAAQQNRLEGDFRRSPQPRNLENSRKSQSPRPWTGFLNAAENSKREAYLLRSQKDRSQSPRPWHMPNESRSLDEDRLMPCDRASPKPKWSSLRERATQEHFPKTRSPNHFEKSNILLSSENNDPYLVTSDIISPKSHMIPLKERSVDSYLAAIKKGPPSNPSWRRLSSPRNLDDPYLFAFNKKDLVDQTWRTKNCDIKEHEPPSSPKARIKHPAPWRHSIVEKSTITPTKSNDEKDDCSGIYLEETREEEGALKSEYNPKSPKPWDEMDKICQKMQVEDYSQNSKTTFKLVNNDTWPEGNSLSEETRKHKTNDTCSGLSATWQPESSDSASAGTTPDSPKATEAPITRSPGFHRKPAHHLGAIGENRPKPKTLVDRMFTEEDRTPTLLSSSPIDLAAMEAESEEEEEKVRRQGVFPKTATPVKPSENNNV